MEYINIIVALQILFLFLILYFKNNNYLNKLLSIILLIPAITFVFNVLDILNILPNDIFGIAYFITFPIAFLFAPLIFYYIYLLCGENISLKHPLFIVSALTLLYGFYGLVKFIWLSSLEKDAYVRSIKNDEFPTEILTLSLLFFFLQQIYFTFSAIKIYRFKKKVANTLSSRSNLKIDFTQRLIILIWILNIISTVSYSLFSRRMVEFIMIPLVIFLIINFIFYYAFKYQAIFNEDTYKIFLKDIKLINSVPIAKKANPTIKNKLLAENIQDLLERNKSYLNPDYTIFDMSKELNCSYNEVSIIINKEIGLNFSQLINNYRVEESKILLKEKIDSLTIEAIGKSAGFKSRASFYRAFKNKTGKTPTEYIKS